MYHMHIISFSGSSKCLHVKPLKSYTNCHVHKPHLRRNKIHINTFSITEFWTEKWSWMLLNWLNLRGGGYTSALQYDMTLQNLIGQQTIKTKHKSLEQMTCTHIVYKIWIVISLDTQFKFNLLVCIIIDNRYYLSAFHVWKWVQALK